MAFKRRKKPAATQVAAAPTEANAKSTATAAKADVTRGEVAATSGKLDVTRGEISATSGRVDAKRAKVAATADQPAKTNGELAAVGGASGAMPDRDQNIREQAYHIWKRAGEPHGRDDEHWTLAEQMLQGK